MEEFCKNQPVLLAQLLRSCSLPGQVRMRGVGSTWAALLIWKLSSLSQERISTQAVIARNYVSPDCIAGKEKTSQGQLSSWS